MDKPVQTSGWKALGMAWQLGYAIAIPIVVLALVGRLVDKWFGTSPLFLLAGTVLAIIVSTVWIIKKAKDIERGLTEKQ